MLMDNRLILHFYMKKFRALVIIVLSINLLILCEEALGTNYNSQDWYVRPATQISYGSGDGSSYQNAWSGLLNVTWGDGGVKSGDTLWICGLHVHRLKEKQYIATQADIPVISGLNDEQRTTIRGDCPNDQGIVWGAYRMDYENWKSEGDGIWSITTLGNVFPDWFFEGIGIPENSSFTVLDKAESLEDLREKPGSHFSTDYTNGSKLYVHLTDGTNPTGKIYSNSWGYDFKLNGKSFIIFSKLKLLNPNRIEPLDSFSYIRWEECQFAYGAYALLAFYDSTHHIDVKNSELSWAANGIYNLSTTNNAPHSYTYSGLYIHDIGVRKVNYDPDAHGIGVQGGHSGLIEDNVIERAGSGITFYAFTNQNFRSTIVRRNIVRDLHQFGGANGRGIETSSNNNSLSDKSGNEFYENDIINVEVGMRFQWEDKQIVYSNTITNSTVGLETTRNYNGIGANISFYNNFIQNSQDQHVAMRSGATDITLDLHDNTYTSPAIFHFKSNNMAFSEWQDQAVDGGPLDRGSVILGATSESDDTPPQPPTSLAIE